MKTVASDGAVVLSGPGPPGAAGYQAFISYSHAADGKLTPAVQTALQRLGKKWYRLRAARVFRDKTSLSANPALWPAIEAALSDSDFFLLCASPDAARSPWVTRETEWWLANRDASRILLVVTGGEIVWDSVAGEFDWARTDCLPATLKGRFRDEPLYVDLRWARGQDDLSLRHSQFRSAMLDLAATIHGTPKDELDSEDIRQHRRLKIVSWTGLVLLAALTVVSIGAMLRARENARVAEERRLEAEEARGIAEDRRVEAEDAREVAEQRRVEAEEAQQEAERRREAEAIARQAEQEQRQEAERRSRIALARYLASEALVDIDSRPVRNLLMALEAIRTTRDSDGDTIPAAEHALRRLLRGSGGTPLNLERRATALAFSPDGRHLVAVSGARPGQASTEDNAIQLWDVTRAPAALIAATAVEYPMSAVAFGDQGRTILVTAQNGTAYRWNPEMPNQRPVSFFGEADSPAYPWWATVFSPDARVLVRAGGPARRGVSLRPLGEAPLDSELHGSQGELVSLAVAGTYIAAGSLEGNVYLWNREVPEKTIAALRPGSQVWSVALDRDARRLAVGFGDGSVGLWQLSPAGAPLEPPVTVMRHQSPVTALTFSPDGEWLASGSGDPMGPPARDYTIRLARVAGAAVSASMSLAVHEREVLALAFSPDGRWLASAAGDRTIRLFDWRARDPRVELRELHGHSAGVQSLAFSADGRWLATGTGSPFSISNDPTALLWSLGRIDETADATVLRSQRSVNTVAFSRDGTRLVTGGASPRLWVVPPDSAEPIVLPGHPAPVDAAAFSGDGRWLATACRDGKARLWDLTHATSDAPVRTLEGHQSLLVTLGFSPDSRWLVTGSQDATVRLWDLNASAGTPPVVLTGHSHFIVRTAFSPNGRWLAAASGQPSERGRDQRGRTTALVWRLADGDSPAAIPLHGHLDDVLDVAFSPDGAWLATASMDGTVRLWHTASFAHRPSSFELRGHDDVVSAVVFSPDGDRLASAGMDGTVRLWNVGSPRPGLEPVVLDHPANVLALAFSPDGRWLATGAADGVTRLWRVRLDELMDLAARTAGRSLSDEERRQFLGEGAGATP